MIRKTSYVSNIIQTFNSIYPFNFIIVQFPKEFFLTWLQTERSDFSYGHTLAFYRDILPRLQGTKIRSCHFCLPSALALPCNHSMWSVLSGFSLRSETKVPSPEAFTAVTTLQMSALACPLSLLLPPESPQIYLTLHFFPFPPSEHSKSLPEKLSTCVCARLACARKTNFYPVSIPSLLPKGRRGIEEKEGETLSPLAHSRDFGCHQMLVIALVPHGAASYITPRFLPNNQPHHYHSSLQGKKSLQTTLLLLWSKPLIVFSHAYGSDFVLPFLFLFIFSPLLS